MAVKGENSKKIGGKLKSTFAAATSTMRKSWWNLGQHQEKKTIVNIFSSRATSLRSDLFCDPVKPCFHQVERHPPYRASLYVLVREGKVVCHSERHKPSWKGSESTTVKVPIPVPISFFLTHLTWVLYDKKERAKDSICKMTSEGMHLRTGLFNWLLGLKARYPLYPLRLYLLPCMFQVGMLCPVTLSFSSLNSDERSIRLLARAIHV